MSAGSFDSHLAISRDRDTSPRKNARSTIQPKISLHTENEKSLAEPWISRQTRRRMSVVVEFRVNLIFAIFLRPRTLTENCSDHRRNAFFQFTDCDRDFRHIVIAGTGDEDRAGWHVDDRCR